MARPVASVDKRIAKLMDDMVETMQPANGVGLAAPQVGLLDRVIVVNVSDNHDPSKAIRMANPEIVWSSEETKPHEEGCLSLPW